MQITITLDDEDLSLFKMLKKIKESCSDGHSMPIVLDKGEMAEELIWLDGDGDFMIDKIELID